MSGTVITGNGGGGAVSSVDAGSSKVTVAPTTGDVIVDVDPAEFTGIPQSGVTDLVDDLNAIEGRLDDLESPPDPEDGAAWGTAQMGFWGSGDDGALDFDGVNNVLGLAPAANVYTLNRDIRATTINIAAGVTIRSSGWRIYASTSLTGGAGALIHANGTAGSDGTLSGGGAGGAGSVGGAGGSVGNGTAGGNGGATGGGVAGASGAQIQGPFGFAAGASAGQVGNGLGDNPGLGGGGGGNGTSAGGNGGNMTLGSPSSIFSVDTLYGCMSCWSQSGLQIRPGTGGGGGRGSVAPSSGGGGGGGGGGGVCFVAAYEILGTVTIQANGGLGGNAYQPAGNGGGGGGGAGGFAICIIGRGPFPTVEADGAAGGQSGPAGGGDGGQGGQGHVRTWKIGL